MKLLLIIGGVLLTSIVAIIQYFEDEKNKSDAEANEKALNKKIDGLKENNTELSNQLSGLLIENSKLSHQLTETSLKLNETAIGSGDFKIEITMINSSEFRFKFTNEASLPAYDTYITITNNNELLKCGIIRQDEKDVVFSRSCIENSHQEAPVTINSHAAMISNKSYSVDSDLNFTINIISRKKSLMIQYAIIFKDGLYQFSSRNFEIVSKKPIFIKQNINRDLPKDFWENYFFGTREIKYQ